MNRSWTGLCVAIAAGCAGSATLAGRTLAAAGWLFRRLALGLLPLGLGLAAAVPAGAQTQPEEYVVVPSASEQAATREQLGAGFRVAKTEHFRVFSDTSPRYHTVVAGLLEQFYQLVRPRFFARDMDPVDFYLIHGGKDYERFLKQRGLPAPSGYGLYDSSSRTLYARRYFPDGRESGIGTLFHEAIHAMIHADFGDAPPPRWLNEGFASLFEAGRVMRGQWVYGNPNPWRETPFRKAFAQGRVPTLESLLHTPDAELDGDDERRNLLYNSGRSLFLYVLRNHGESALAHFLRSVQTGTAPGRALSTATGLSLPELERRWNESIQQLNFGGDYLYRGTGPEALRILEEGVQRHPSYGNLQLALAFEHLKRGNHPEALEHARRALDDPHLLFRQQAHFVVARALITTDAKVAARALQISIAFQPWNEQILGDDYELLAFMLERVGKTEQAERLRSELAEMRKRDER